MSSVLRALSPLGIVFLAACGTPTEVTIVLSTNACGDSYRATTIGLGRPVEKIADATSVARTTSCEADGGIGTFVIVPGSAGSADSFEVEVVTGLGKDPAECAADDYAGCIVATRVARFDQQYDIPIFMDKACEGVVCAGGATCMAGVCARNDIVPGSCQTDGGCRIGDASDDGSEGPAESGDSSPSRDAAPPMEAAPPPPPPPPPSTSACIATCEQDNPTETFAFAECICDPSLCSTSCGGPTCTMSASVGISTSTPACSSCIASSASRCDNPNCKSGGPKMPGSCSAVAACIAKCAAG
jgi:hypothetical protein